MNIFLRTALAARASLAAPIRRARLKQLAARGRAPVSVLFYHRVSDEHPNCWTISRDIFRRHVDYCCRHMDLIDLAEVQRRVGGDHSSSPAVSFTFDDGYAENCDFALPLLIDRQIPCTYFVTTSHVRNRAPFLHDTRAGIPLKVNTVAQIREAANNGVEIGCHARTHFDFSRAREMKVIRREIVDAKDELEQMIGKPVRYFAFPYGLPAHLTPEAIDVIQDAGFVGFCSAFGGYNLPGRDAFHIRRCHGDPEFSRFVNWLSFDPRKLRNEPTVSYGSTAREQSQATDATPTSQASAIVVDLPSSFPQATESCG